MSNTGLRSLAQGFKPDQPNPIDAGGRQFWLYDVPGVYTWTCEDAGDYLFALSGGGGGGGLGVDDNYLAWATGGTSGTCGFVHILLSLGDQVTIKVGAGGAAPVATVTTVTAFVSATGGAGANTYINAPKGYFADQNLYANGGEPGTAMRPSGTLPRSLQAPNLPDIINNMTFDLYKDAIQSSGITADADSYYFDARSPWGYGLVRDWRVGLWPDNLIVGWTEGTPVPAFRVCATAGAPPRQYPPFPVGNGGSPFIRNVIGGVNSHDPTEGLVNREFMPPKWGGGGGGTVYYRNNVLTTYTGQKGADGYVMILKDG